MSQGPKRPLRTAETHSTIQGAKSPPPTPKALPTYLLQQKKMWKERGREIICQKLGRADPTSRPLAIARGRGGKGGWFVVLCTKVALAFRAMR